MLEVLALEVMTLNVMKVNSLSNSRNVEHVSAKCKKIFHVFQSLLVASEEREIYDVFCQKLNFSGQNQKKKKIEFDFSKPKRIKVTKRKISTIVISILNAFSVEISVFLNGFRDGINVF